MENKHLIIIILVLAIIEVCIMGGYAFYVGTSHEDTNNVVEDDNSNVINTTTDMSNSKIVEESNNDEEAMGDGPYYPTSKYAPDVDNYGTTREEAINKDMRYIPIVDEGVDYGGYVPYDPVNGCYHT